MKNRLRIEFRKLAAEAMLDLKFGYERDDKFQVYLLSQRSVTEINAYLLSRADRIRETCGKKHVIEPNLVYVVIREEKPNRFDFQLMQGTSYYFPKVTILNEKNLREIWEYSLCFAEGRTLYEFDRFLEMQIVHALRQVRLYEERLDGEIHLLDYVLSSLEGTAIHSILYDAAKNLFDQRTHQVQVLRVNGAPECMLQAAEIELLAAQDMLEVIGAAKPRAVS